MFYVLPELAVSLSPMSFLGQPLPAQSIYCVLHLPPPEGPNDDHEGGGRV